MHSDTVKCRSEKKGRCGGWKKVSEQQKWREEEAFRYVSGRKRAWQDTVHKEGLTPEASGFTVQREKVKTSASSGLENMLQNY